MGLEEILNASREYRWAMLGRLESDLNYYNNFMRFSKGGEERLYFKNLEKHLEAIEAIKKSLAK